MPPAQLVILPALAQTVASRKTSRRQRVASKDAPELANIPATTMMRIERKHDEDRVRDRGQEPAWSLLGKYPAANMTSLSRVTANQPRFCSRTRPIASFAKFRITNGAERQWKLYANCARRCAPGISISQKRRLTRLRMMWDGRRLPMSWPALADSKEERLG
jgi:hypothetical protein